MRTTPAAGSGDTTRRRILDAASALYRQGGIAALSTDALARAVGTSKRTLYQHFANRDAILEAVLLERMERHAADLAAVLATPAPVPVRIARYAETTALLPRDFPPGFWAELWRTAPAVAERVRARRDAIGEAALARLLEEGVASGDIRADVPVPLMVAIASVLAENLLLRDPPPGHAPFALAEAGIALMLDGVRAHRA